MSMTSSSTTMSTSSSGRSRRIMAVFTAVISAVFFFAIFHSSELQSNLDGDYVRKLSNYEINVIVSSLSHRKLLSPERSVDKPDRFWGDSKCSNSDIQVNQGPSAALPSGIPTYTVDIINACYSGCNISDIHIRCGWFRSARLIDPLIFKRVGYNDCLVNGGRPLANGQAISFQYADTRPYPLDVSSLNCV